MRYRLTLTALVAVAVSLVGGGTVHAKPRPDVAGGEITADRAPWIVSLWGNGVDGQRHQLCGGALIAPRWVLTTAHCADLAGAALAVRIGVNKREDGATIRPVRVVKHPQYQASTMHNDIALLELADVVAGTAPIPLRNFGIRASASVRAMGWGVHDEKDPAGSAVLRHVDTTIVDGVGCQWAAPLFHPEQMNCYSAAEMKLPCLNDSGGPVVFRDPGTGAWALVGLINGGDSYCPYGTDFPWFGVRAETFRPWIISLTGRLHNPGPF